MSFARSSASRFASVGVAGSSARLAGGSTGRTLREGSVPASSSSFYSYSSSYPTPSTSSTTILRAPTAPAGAGAGAGGAKVSHTRFSASTPPKISVIRNHGVVKSSSSASLTLPSGSARQSNPSRSSSRSSASPSSSSSSSSGSSSKAWRPHLKFNAHAPPKGGWCSIVYSISLGLGLGFGMIVFPLLRDTIHCEGAEQGGKKSGKQAGEAGAKPAYGLDQVTLICLVGVGSSGKSTQASRLPKRFEGFEVISGVSSVDQVHKEVQKRAEKNGEKETLLVLDGYPATLEEAQKIEKETCPIFVVLYFDLPKEKYAERAGQSSSSQDWDKSSSAVLPLVKHFRNRGNILEISADWDSADEVWEQVEAKVEQVLELKEMGEDVSVA